MNTISKIIMASVIASSLFASPVFAQGWVNESIDPGHPRVNEVDTRIDNQERRVQQDEARGLISPGQAARDDRHLNNIQNRTDRDMAHNGGHLTLREQRNLNYSLNRDNNHIHNQRVNDGTARRY